jgi:hypothetical protein
MGVLYVAGLPLLTSLLLWRNRNRLFGEGSEAVMKKHGFLYADYGPTACYWEVTVTAIYCHRALHDMASCI